MFLKNVVLHEIYSKKSQWPNTFGTSLYVWKTRDNVHAWFHINFTLCRLLYPQNLNGLEHSIEKLYQSRHLFVQNIFLDGKPTERNPHPMLKLGYENKATPGRRKLLRKHLVSKKPRIDKADQLDDDTSIQSVSAPTVFGLCFIYSPSLLPPPPPGLKILDLILVCKYL